MYLSCLVGQFPHFQFVHAQTSPCHLVLCCHLEVDLVEEFTKFIHHEDLILGQVEAEAGAHCWMVS